MRNGAEVNPNTRWIRPRPDSAVTSPEAMSTALCPLHASHESVGSGPVANRCPEITRNQHLVTEPDRRRGYVEDLDRYDHRGNLPPTHDLTCDLPGENMRRTRAGHRPQS